MLFVYVDNILALSHRAKDIIKEIITFFKAKDGSIRPPEIYLGVNVAKMQLPDGREVWMTSPRTYVLRIPYSLLKDYSKKTARGTY
jgi:hypothetical protein